MLATSPGRTSMAARPSCGPMTARACNTTFTSSTQNWAWATTGFPFRLQIYLNGHHGRAAQLWKAPIDFTVHDHAFTQIADWEQAQRWAESRSVEKSTRSWTHSPRRFCPVIAELETSYPWSWDQTQDATDIVFHRQSDWQSLYDNLTRTVLQAVKPEHVATFLGRKRHGNAEDELGNRSALRIPRTRIKHTLGPVSLKMYYKFGLILRIETNVKDVASFPHYREVEQGDGTRVIQ